MILVPNLLATQVFTSVRHMGITIEAPRRLPRRTVGHRPCHWTSPRIHRHTLVTAETLGNIGTATAPPAHPHPLCNILPPAHHLLLPSGGDPGHPGVALMKAGPHAVTGKSAKTARYMFPLWDGTVHPRLRPHHPRREIGNLARTTVLQFLRIRHEARRR